MWYVCQICIFCSSANNTELHFWCYLSCYLLYVFGTAKTMHYHHQCKQWQNLLHIYATCQYQIIVDIIIWTSFYNMYVFQCGLWAVTDMCTTESGAICTVSCTQSYFHYTSLPASGVQWDIYTEQFSLLTERKATMDILFYTAVHHLHQVLSTKDGYMSSPFIGMKMIYHIISDECCKYESTCNHKLLKVVTWKHFSQLTCVLWQKVLSWIHLHIFIDHINMV